jgi:NAD+--dinitrogen-reductase ADP-D-ribosyltransferase
METPLPPVPAGHPLSMNWCHLPPWIIGSSEFNAAPTELSIAGVRRSSRPFFQMLEETPSAKDRGQAFHDYLTVRYQLHHYTEYQGASRSSLRNSYIRFLRGWEVDCNGCEGAVLKSWVESRFGITPTYHGGILKFEENTESERFAHDRMRGTQKTNAIFSQLDLLFEFCQYEIQRRFPGREDFLLYRGTNDPQEHPLIEQKNRRESCLRLNNIVSFTSDREKAWEFGSTVWEVHVPCVKVIFFSGLLPDSLLYGENEYLVIGGNYWVKELIY